MPASTETILLVEDTRGDALLYSALLRRVSSAQSEIEHASSLGEAMRMLEATSYVAVLLDLGLPDCDGLQGLERIVEHHPEVAVIVLTGRDDEDIGERAIAAGAQDYLHKGEARPPAIGRALRHALARQRLENRAREAAQELHVLFDRNPLPIFVYDEQTLAILAANDAAISFYGYTLRELLQMAITDIRPEEERERFLRALHGSFDAYSGKDWLHRTRDGRVVTVQVHSERIRFQGRDCRIGIVQDVTGQRLAQQRLADSERRYRDVFEHSLGYICTHTLDGALQSINPAAAQALGRTPASMLGHSLRDFMPEPDRPYFDQYMQRIRDHGEDHGLLPTVHRNGETRIWRYHNRLLHRDESTPVVLGFAHDVTERRRMERQLRDKTAELEAVNDAAPLGLFRTDARGRCIYVNRTYERLAGISQEQVLGDGWLQAIHPDDRVRVSEEWAQAVAGGEERFAGRQRFLHTDGRVVWCKVHAASLVIDGTMTGYFGTLQDITREREAESARRRGDRRLATLADALPLLLMFLDRHQRVEFINSGWSRELRLPPEQILGRPVLELVRGTAAECFADGIAIAQRGIEHSVDFDDPDETAIRTWNAVFIPQRDSRDRIDGIHVMLRDVTLEKAHRQELVRRAEQDALTGTLNRAGFEIQGRHLWTEATRQGRSLGVFYFDLDGFKAINDTLGHAAGDGLLQEVSVRIRDCLRTDDIVGRIGGDEFAVIASHVSGGEAARRVADKLIAAVHASALQRSGPAAEALYASCSVGYCIADAATISMEEALRRADQALYAAKRAGKGRALAWPPGTSPDIAQRSGSRE